MVERLFDRIFSSLALRKVYHFVSGLLLFLMVYRLNDAGIYVTGVLYLLAFLAFGKRVSFAVIGVLLLFAITRSRFATLAAIVIFILGDGFAALIGSKYGERHLPWNGDKTVVGSAAFLGSSAIGMFIYVSGVPQIRGWEKCLLVLVPSLVACVFESVPILVISDRKRDDNFVIILVSGLIVFFLMGLLSIPDAPEWLLPR